MVDKSILNAKMYDSYSSKTVSAFSNLEKKMIKKNITNHIIVI